MNNRIIVILVLFFLTLLLQAQVTIGKSEAPVTGALLQLKNLDSPINSGEANADRGMILPRVKLSKLDKLYPMLDDGYDPTEEAKHIGLMVYNLSEASIMLCKGLYVWTGAEWQRIPKPCSKNEWQKNHLLFYKSALVPKTIDLELSMKPYTVSWQDDGVIPWRTNGFPNDISRSITEVFSFQPEVNNTNVARTATVNAKVDMDGVITTETITIEQLEREMIFKPEETELFPANSTEYVIPTESEAKWTAVSRDATNSMISDYDNSEQDKGIASYTIRLEDNPTWAERSTMFDISSSDPDFLPRTMKVRQDYVRPYIKDLSTTNLDLGELAANASKTISFNSNANWKLSAGTGHYANIVSSPSVAIGQTVTNAGAKPTLGKPQSYSFTALANNDAIAGTVYSTTLAFETVTGTSDVDKKNVVVSRKVPIRWVSPNTNVSGLTSLPRAGAVINTQAYTNAEWSRGASTHAVNGNETQAASPYGLKTAQIAIKNNDTWAARNVYFAIWRTGGAQTGQTLSQAAWTLDYASAHNITNPIHRVGSKADFDAGRSLAAFKSPTGNPASQYRARLADNTIIATANIPATNGNDYFHGDRILIPARADGGVPSWSDRTIYFDLVRGSGGAINNIFNLTQKGYDSRNAGTNAHGATIASDATNAYFVDVATTYGCPNFRVGVTNGINAAGQPAAGWVWLENRNDLNVGRRHFHVPANTTSANRPLYFFVEQTGNKWVHVATATQEAYNPYFELAPNLWISKQGFYGNYSINSARDACSSINGYLPSASQLKTIFTTLGGNRSHPYFPKVDGDMAHWSSTRDSQGVDIFSANIVNYMQYGGQWYNHWKQYNMFPNSVLNAIYVRCMRTTSPVSMEVNGDAIIEPIVPINEITNENGTTDTE